MQEIRSKLRQAYNWKGFLMHLHPSQTLEALSPPMLEALYEALMSRFDPDLFEIRMERKAKALDDVNQREQEAAESTIARLEAAKAEGDRERLRAHVDACRRLDEAAGK